MAKQIQIAPSILSADFSRLGEEMKALEKAGADVFHLDIMDGHFVSNLTIGPPVVEKLRAITQLPFDAHLMVDNAGALLEDFQKAGCNWISVHAEACPHLHGTITQIQKLGMKAGVALNPGTSLTHLDAVIDQIDYALLMSVNPGFGGQSFIPSTLDKIRVLRQAKPNLTIQVDGGIKLENIREVFKAGADIVVVGTGLLKAQDYGQRISELRKACA